jgi:hypothetical protein
MGSGDSKDGNEDTFDRGAITGWSFWGRYRSRLRRPVVRPVRFEVGTSGVRVMVGVVFDEDDELRN